ncbi:MAG: thioredoxin [Clostridiales bacterium]|nr:thioredoxin [Clostridiales bacterium]
MLKITKDNFNEEVKSSEKPVLVDFWAAWCGPCKMMGPVINEIAESYPDIKVGKVNIDEEQPLAIEYGISVIPTLIIFKDGKPVRSLTGYHEKDEVARELGL